MNKTDHNIILMHYNKYYEVIISVAETPFINIEVRRLMAEDPTIDIPSVPTGTGFGIRIPLCALDQSGNYSF